MGGWGGGGGLQKGKRNVMIKVTLFLLRQSHKEGGGTWEYPSSTINKYELQVVPKLQDKVTFVIISSLFNC